VILSIGNKYSVRDLLCDVICNLPAKKQYASHSADDVSAPSGISSH